MKDYFHICEPQDRTKVILTNFLMVGVEFGFNHKEHGFYYDWVENEGFKEVDNYRAGVRACVCTICGRTSFQNLTTKEDE